MILFRAYLNLSTAVGHCEVF